MTAQPKNVADARELLQFAELHGVQPVRFLAERIPRSARESGDVPEDAVGFRPFLNHDELRTRVRMRMVSEDAVLESEFEARWRFSEPVTFGAAVLIEFMEKVALMTIVPFLRESLASNAARLHVQVPELGLVRQGEVALNFAEGEIEQLIAKAWTEEFD